MTPALLLWPPPRGTWLCPVPGLEAVRGWVSRCRASGTPAQAQGAEPASLESAARQLALHLLAQTRLPATLDSDVCSWTQRLHRAGAGGLLDKPQGKRQALKRL